MTLKTLTLYAPVNEKYTTDPKHDSVGEPTTTIVKHIYMNPDRTVAVNFGYGTLTFVGIPYRLYEWAEKPTT